MLFSSIMFIFYFLPVTLLFYYLCAWSRKLQNFILLVGSLAFYAWGEPKYILLMIGSVLLNYIMGLCISKFQHSVKTKRVLLIATIIANTLILCVFKYLNFIIRTMNEAMEGMYTLQIVSIVLPLGISFFTFQAMSYVIDVYRGEVPAQKNPFMLGLYISFFPQLVAGPIVKYESMKEQITNRKESVTKFSVGSCRFIVGLSKKVLISNQMAVMADHIFNLQEIQNVPMLLAWLGAIAYTLQIYYDFSGYSDMAIGLSLMFGFHFPENFNYPYVSKSITEFWRRWHISLSSWFRDYVYIPLGGSRRNMDTLVRNLFVVWLLTGIWHGAEWTFVFWGIYNFIFIMFEKITHMDQRIKSSTVRHIYSMFVIIIGWVIFRSNNLVHAGRCIGNMFTLRGGFFSDTAAMFIRENIVFIVLGILFSFPVARKTNEYMMERKKGTASLSMFYPVVMVGLFLLCVTYLVKGSYNPFIYYNF